MPEVKRRVVLLQRSGLHRIVGTFDSSVHELRPLVNLNGTIARLKEQQPRYVIYAEEAPAPLPESFKQFVEGA